MKLYGRYYQLIVGNDKESKIITDLNIDFEITKTLTSEPNPATFTITNLNRSTQALLVDKKYDRVLFNFGYDGEIKTLFIGWIDNAENKKESTETKTILTCSDGQVDYRESRIATTVSKGATDKDIVEQALKTMPNTSQGIVDIQEDRKLPRGKVLVGSTRNILKSVAKNHNADWSIQDGKLLILKNDSALANNEGFLLSEDTGMVGSPMRTSNGIEVRCFLNNVMRVGQLCRIKSVLSEYSGDYKITKLVMKGGTNSNECYSILEVQNGTFHEVQEVKKK